MEYEAWSENISLAMFWNYFRRQKLLSITDFIFVDVWCVDTCMCWPEGNTVSYRLQSLSTLSINISESLSVNL